MHSSIAFVVVAIGLATGCGKGDTPPPPTTGSPSAKPETGPREQAPPPPSAPAVAAGSPAEQASMMFRSVCATCHGPEGRGNGPAAANMNPKPRDYSDPAWQASVNDDDLKRIIVKGGTALGKSAMMPENPQLKDKPEVLDALVQMIRGFAKN